MKLFCLAIFIYLNAIPIGLGEGHKILGICPTRWNSHWSLGAAIMKELARSGHDITFVSPFELKEPNVRNIILTNYPEENRDLFDLADISPFLNFVLLPHIFESVINFTLSHSNVHELYKEQFDAVIVEVFHSEALLGFGAHFQCPVIGFTTFGTSMYSNIMTGTPNPPSYTPNLFLPYTDHMNFPQRIHNSLAWWVDELYLRFSHFPKQRKLYEKYFPDVKEQFEDQRTNLSVLLNNNFFVTKTIMPGMSNTVDIGGIHVEPAKPLPKDIQEFLDKASDGVILFSMGSMLKAVNWPPEKREAFVKTFGKLKQKVLWKYENETLPDKPDNVMIRSWIPQRDILTHPNVKLFITHGGLLGSAEALVEGVPVLGIPVYGDQLMNINMAVARGNALSLNFHDVTEESLTKVLAKALGSKELLVKAKESSRIYTDRPMSPQKTAVYWIEYAIRHRGAKHLRPAGLDLNYFAFHSIDVYAFFLAVFIVAYYLCKFTSRKLLQMFRSARNQNMKHKFE